MNCKEVMSRAAISLCCFLTNTAPYAQDWVPVHEEPRHRLVFENERARILDVNLAPGYVSLYHRHEIDMLYVTITGAKVWAQPLGDDRREADVETGDLRFSSDNHGLPHIHRVGNTGSVPFHVIGIGIKGGTSHESAPLSGDTTRLETAIEKPHASVYRIRLQPGEKTGNHTHHLPFTAVYLTAGILSVNEEAPAPVEAGGFRWQAEASHYYENHGSHPVEIIEMQWH
jgi:quercetin dioxygenase-like cupin family protein